MRMLALLVALGIVGTVGAQAPAPAGSIAMDVTGRVSTGLVAIGGETTGAAIATPGGFRCELAGKVDEKLDGKIARVKGTFQVKPGVEIRARAILTVESIEVVEARPQEQVARARVVGKLKTGVVAPGGATTGILIEAAGTTWEVEIKDKDARAVAEKLGGMLVETSGTVEVRKSPAAPPRPRTILTVEKVEAKK